MIFVNIAQSQPLGIAGAPIVKLGEKKFVDHKITLSPLERSLYMRMQVVSQAEIKRIEEEVEDGAQMNRARMNLLVRFCFWARLQACFLGTCCPFLRPSGRTFLCPVGLFSWHRHPFFDGLWHGVGARRFMTYSAAPSSARMALHISSQLSHATFPCAESAFFRVHHQKLCAGVPAPVAAAVHPRCAAGHQPCGRAGGNRGV